MVYSRYSALSEYSTASAADTGHPYRVLYEQSQDMGLQILPDGTVVADSPKELAEYHILISDPAQSDVCQWDGPSVRLFLRRSGDRTQEVITAALAVGEGGSVKELAGELSITLRGVGGRVRKAVADARMLAPHRPTPFHLQGPPGRKTVTLDPSFVTAYADPTMTT